MSRIQKKLGAFVARHGFTFRAWWIALVIFPPGAILIPLKIPHISLALKTAMIGFTVALHASLTLGGSALLVGLAARAWRAVFGA